MFMDKYNAVMEGAENAQFISMNFFKNAGTILSNVVQLDSCFEDWSGKCAGRRLGTVVFSLLDPSIAETWHNLKNDILV